MKRTCKNIDITDPVFVSQSIGHFMAHRTGKEMNRSDIVKLYAEYGTSDNIAVQMVDDFKGGDLKLTPVRITKKRDSSNGKLRDIAIEGIKQQLYEQTVFDALKDAAKCVGEYQCTCLKNQPKYLYKKDGTVQTKIVGRGQIWAKDVMYGWWSDPKIRYRVYPDKVTLRNRDYVKCKRAFKRLNKKKSLHNSQSAVSYYGMLKNSDSYRFRKKYHVKRLNRQARRYISHESKIQRETGPGEVYDHWNKDNGSDLSQ